MRMAVAKLGPLKNPLILVDGNHTVPELAHRQLAIVQGDGKSLSIGAASIIAKVTRDHCMERFDKIHPGYGFAKHKGYGTAAHMKAITELGPCPQHRHSFLPLWTFRAK